MASLKSSGNKPSDNGRLINVEIGQCFASAKH